MASEFKSLTQEQLDTLQDLISSASILYDDEILMSREAYAESGIEEAESEILNYVDSLLASKDAETPQEIVIEAKLLEDEYVLRLEVGDIMACVDIDLVQERLAVQMASHMKIEHADLLIALLKEGQRRLVKYKNGEGYE